MRLLTESIGNQKQYLSNALYLTNKRITVLAKALAGVVNHYLRGKTQGKHREMFTIRLYIRSFNFEKTFDYDENNARVVTQTNMPHNAEDPILTRYAGVVKKLSAGMERAVLADDKFVHESVQKFVNSAFGSSGKSFQNASTSMSSAVVVSVLEFPEIGSNALISGSVVKNLTDALRKEAIDELGNIVEAVSVEHTFRVGTMPVQFNINSGSIDEREYVQNVFMVGVKWKSGITTTQETEKHYYSNEDDRDEAIKNNLEMMRFHRTKENPIAQQHINMIATNIRSAAALGDTSVEEIIKSLRDSLTSEGEAGE